MDVLCCVVSVVEVDGSTQSLMAVASEGKKTELGILD